MGENDISWDLSEMFSGIKDPQINKRISDLENRVNIFVKNYKGKMQSINISSSYLLDALKEYEQIFVEAAELDSFAEYSYVVAMTDTDIETFYHNIDEFLSKIRKSLTFFGLDLAKVCYEKKELINDKILASYKHFLERRANGYPYLLSESEEQIIQEKDQYGVKAWEEIQRKWLNTREFNVKVGGKIKKLTYGQANSLLSNPVRNTRIAANKEIYGVLGKNEIVFTSALRNICSDWVKIAERRKYPSITQQSLLANDCEQETIDNLMKAIEKNVKVYRRYLMLKSKILGLPKLQNPDIMAPIPKGEEGSALDEKLTWADAKALALEAYNKFDAEFGKYVLDMFEKNHIDASPRKAKRNGAFCGEYYKGKSAFILMTYTGSLHEVFTLTHELGHAVHDYLMSMNLPFLNLSIPMTVAETASTFGELLLTDLLLSKAKSDKEKIGLLCSILDESGQAIFQVSARYWFENELYNAVKKGEPLDGEAISKLWCKNRDKIYGDTVTWYDVMRWEWTMKPHYFFANFRFYNYPYVYANLFVYALYNLYKQQGKSFIPKFKKFLASGGSLNPVELSNIMGLDVTKPEFWELGIKQYNDFIDMIEKAMKSH